MGVRVGVGDEVRGDGGGQGWGGGEGRGGGWG